MKNKITILIIFLISNILLSQNDSQKIIDKFFEIYSVDTDSAIDYIFSTSGSSIDKKADGISNLKGQLNDFKKEVGEFYKYSLYKKLDINSDLVYYIYIINYEDQPLKLSFIMYKPNQEWKCYYFGIDFTFYIQLINSLNNRLIEM